MNQQKSLSQLQRSNFQNINNQHLHSYSNNKRMSHNLKIRQSPNPTHFKTDHTFTSNEQYLNSIQQQYLQHHNNNYTSSISSNQQINNNSKNIPTSNNNKSDSKFSYDEQYQLIYEEIVEHEYFNKISKHEKIRINKWLTKLSNISVNQLWKKNRNNYIKLIKLMFDCEVIIAPFQMIPPDRDLHKLTHHQINVIINQIQKIVNQRENKQLFNNGNKSTRREKQMKISWIQQSAYIDHQQSMKSLERNQSILIGNQKKRIQSVSSAFVQFIPPKYPSTTKNSQQKKLQLNQQQSQNENQKLIKVNRSEQKTNKADYFIKKQRIKTFQTEYNINQQDYDLMRNIKNHDENNNRIYQIDEFQQKQKQALLILKCGFKLLQMIPKDKLQQKTSREVTLIYHIFQIIQLKKLLEQDPFICQQLNKQNVLTKSNLKTPLTASNSKLINIVDKDKDYEIKNTNQKNVYNSKQKKKITITLLSHPASLKHSMVK